MEEDEMSAVDYGVGDESEALRSQPKEKVAAAAPVSGVADDSSTSKTGADSKTKTAAESGRGYRTNRDRPREVEPSMAGDIDIEGHGNEGRKEEAESASPDQTGSVFDGSVAANGDAEYVGNAPHAREHTERVVLKAGVTVEAAPASPLIVAGHEISDARRECEEDGKREEEAAKVESRAEEGSRADLRKALVGFYGVHNPGRIATLDVILAQYQGKEDLLIERLEHKYSADLSYAYRAAGKVKPMPGTLARPPSIAITPSAMAAAGGSSAGTGEFHSLSPPNSNYKSAMSAAAGKQFFSHGGSGAVRGGPAAPRSGATTQPPQTAGGASSSSYMTYLAGQIRSNVEGFLPSSGIPAVTLPSPLSLAPSTHSLSSARRPGKDPPDTNNNPLGSPGVVGVVDGGRYRATDGRGVDSFGAVGTRDSRVSPLNRYATVGPSGNWGASHRSSAMSVNDEGSLEGASGSVAARIVGAPEVEKGRADAALARVNVLEEERASLLAACRRMQGKAEAAAREAAATEELREAGQRKIATFAERAAAAERQARETAIRLRTLESGQAALQAEKESSARRCAAKHTQLLSAIDLQMALRSQLEGLLEIVPPSSAGMSNMESRTGRREGEEEHGGQAIPPGSPPASDTAVRIVSSYPDAITTWPTALGVEREGSASVTDGGAKQAASEGISGVGDEGGGGDESGGGGLDEVKRRCSVLEVSLRASRREASDARRARDIAEGTVREQKAALMMLKEKVSDLEASLGREKNARQVVAQAARGLETELDIRLHNLRGTEAKLSEKADSNARLQEELRGAAAQLHTASAARAALLSFCRQERTAVELEAAEHVTRVEESAGMRGEEGLARGLQLARMAEDAGKKRAAAAAEEMDRLGKALFSARAELAGSKAREQTLRGELGRAAEAIAGFSKSAASPVLGTRDEAKTDRGSAVGSATSGAGASGQDSLRDTRRYVSVANPRLGLEGTVSECGAGCVKESRRVIGAGAEAVGWGEVPGVVATARRGTGGRSSPLCQAGYDEDLL